MRGGDAVLLYGDSNSHLFAGVLAGLKIGAIVAPLTEQAPLTRQQAEEIAKPQWSVQLCDESITCEMVKFNRSERPVLLNQLTEEELGGLVLFSSGSSGTPKGILYDTKNLLEKFRTQREPMRALSFLMLDHFGGINTVLTVLCSGGEVIVLPDRTVDSVCAAVDHFRVKVLPTTPTFIKLMLASRSWTRYDMTSLEKITYGTEPMTEGTLRRLREVFPNVELQQTYGLSEVGVLRTRSKPDGSLWVKVGGPGFEIKVKDDILWIKSAYQMRGYLNAEADFDEDGFFNTKDQVLVDGEYIQILGRTSDIINIGGEKVYPAEVEGCIEQMSNIRSVLVYGQANSILGEVIAADIVLVEPEDLESLRLRVRQHCRMSLGARKIPTRVRIVQSLDVSGRQKTIRHVKK